MRKSILLIVSLLILISSPLIVKAEAEQEASPVVHTVLFFSRGCPYCEEALSTILPPIQDQYQAKLSILLVEVSTLDDVNTLYSLGQALGLAKEQVAVPFMLVGQQALVGVDQIKAQLTDLVDGYLAAGGLEYPNIPLLKEIIAKGIDFKTYDPSQLPALQPQTATKPSGMSLAWIIMVFMFIAIILSIVFILRAFQGKPLGNLPKWLDVAIPVLSVLGLGVSIYLTYVEISHANTLCGPVGDCNAVQSSPYAKLFGIIPIGLLGAIGYIAILLAWIWQRASGGTGAKAAGPIMFAMALFGTLFSIYLTYLELYVIHAVCIWCLSSAVIITVLMLLCLPFVTHWLAISDEEEQAFE